MPTTGFSIADFYPRPPRGGRRSAVEAVKGGLQFLSTPSARRATQSGLTGVLSNAISIHALREEGDSPGGRCVKRPGYFYPRPPRGGRPKKLGVTKSAVGFLSTPSARRATTLLAAFDQLNEISIHALREEGDLLLPLTAARSSIFLSTPSARRATHR